MKDSMIYVAGQRTDVELTGTLSGGAVTLALQSRLKKWRPVGIVQLGAAALNEGFSITNTADADGWYHGDPVIDSSNAGSTAVLLVRLTGY